MAKKKVQGPVGSLVPIADGPQVVLDPKGRLKGTLDRLFSDLKPNTLRAYQKAWDMLATYLHLPSRMEAAALIVTLNGGQANELAMAWMAEMRRAKLKPATISARLGAFKGIVKRLRIAGVITWNVEVEGPQVTSYKDTSGPGTEAISKVIEELRGKDDMKSVRDLAIIHSLYTTGLRRGELAHLTMKDLELEKNKIWILGKARDDQESVTIREKTKEALERWLKVRPTENDAVFISLDPNSHGNPLSDQGVWRITISYGLGRPHGIRHSGITKVLELSNGDIRMAQKFSRHKDPKTLIKYDDNLKDRAGEASGLLEEGL